MKIFGHKYVYHFYYFFGNFFRNYQTKGIWPSWSYYQLRDNYIYTWIWLLWKDQRQFFSCVLNFFFFFEIFDSYAAVRNNRDFPHSLPSFPLWWHIAKLQNIIKTNQHWYNLLTFSFTCNPACVCVCVCVCVCARSISCNFITDIGSGNHHHW